jgi:hypothetical protein
MGCTPREEEESAAALLHALGVVSFLLYVSSVFISSHLLKKRSMAIEMGHSLSFLWLFVTHDLVITVPALACVCSSAVVLGGACSPSCSALLSFLLQKASKSLKRCCCSPLPSSFLILSLIPVVSVSCQ